MFKTIKEAISYELVEKKSKFIADLFPIQNEEEAKNIIKEIKKRHYNAKHHCFSYIAFDEKGKLVERYSDDGEPSGTAGAPILNIIKSKKIYNVLVIVTRYFGGILLGTGGLVRAYSEVTSGALNNAKYILKELGKEIKVTVEYSQVEAIKYYCRKKDIKIVKEEYSNEVYFFIEISQKKLEDLYKNIDNLNFKMTKLEEIQEKYIDAT